MSKYIELFMNYIKRQRKDASACTAPDSIGLQLERDGEPFYIRRCTVCGAAMIDGFMLDPYSNSGLTEYFCSNECKHVMYAHELFDVEADEELPDELPFYTEWFDEYSMDEMDLIINADEYARRELRNENR